MSIYYLLVEDYFFHCSISLNPHSSKASEYLYQYWLRVILFFFPNHRKLPSL